MAVLKCRTCGGDLIQKDRGRLIVVGSLMIASVTLVFVVPYFWIPGILLFLTGTYLIVWATAGHGGWCRTCKKFGIF